MTPNIRVTPEWEIGSSDIPSSWTDIIGIEAADPRDRFVAYRTGPVTGFHFDATYGDPLKLQRRRIFRYGDKELMENITLDNDLLENLDVTFENDLDVIVEYTFRNNKRPIDDTVQQ